MDEDSDDSFEIEKLPIFFSIVHIYFERKPSYPLDHLKKLIVSLRRKQTLIVIVFKRYTVRYFKNSFADLVEEFLMIILVIAEIVACFLHEDFKLILILLYNRGIVGFLVFEILDLLTVFLDQMLVLLLENFYLFLLL